MYALLILIFIYLVIAIELKIKERLVPETVLVRVLKPDKNPETDVDCKADIKAENILIEDKPLEKLGSVFEVLNPYYYEIVSEEVDKDKGYYLLNTTLVDYHGEFEIRIVCVSPGFTGVSYTILNNTNMPCELQNKGRFVIC